MSRQIPPPPDDEREEEIEGRKQQIWLIAILMILSFCVGTTIVLTIAWLLIR